MLNTSQTMANYGTYYFFYAVYTLFNATRQFLQVQKKTLVHWTFERLLSLTRAKW